MNFIKIDAFTDVTWKGDECKALYERPLYINLKDISAVDVDKNKITIDGVTYKVSPTSMERVIKAMEKPAAEERIADALEELSKIIDELSREPRRGEIKSRELKINGAITAYNRKAY